MRIDIQNVYQFLPLPNDIKFKIYSILYKNYTIPVDLKEDIETYYLVHYVIDIYQKTFDDTKYHLILLYHDLVRCLYCHMDMFFDAVLINRPFMMCEDLLIKRIKYFWRLLEVDKRKVFIENMENKYIKYGFSV